MIRKRGMLQFGLGAAVLLLVAAQSLSGTAWGDDGRTGKIFSSLLDDAKDSFSEFDFSKVRGCGAREAINLVNTLFSTRAGLGLNDDTDPDEPRQWNSVSGTPTTINLRWTRFSDQTTAGKIFVEAIILTGCQSRRPGDLKEAYVRYAIPVYGSGGNFSVGPPREVKVETVCCGSFRRYNYVYDLTGTPLRMAGTDFPPLPPPAPKPKPATGAGQSSGGRSTASATAGRTLSPPAAPVAPAPTPPKPDPFTMEKVCELCESQKAMVDHLKQRLQKFQTERNQVNKELQDNRRRQAQLDKDLQKLKEELKAQKDVGGESTDPATGITTKSYDDGSGTVVVTRHYPDGRVEEVDRYPRRSTRDTQNEISAKQAEKRRLEQEAQRSQRRLQQLDDAIRQTNSRLQTELARLAACIDLCNLNYGYRTNYQEQYPGPEPAASAGTTTDTVAGTPAAGSAAGAVAETAADTAEAVSPSADAGTSSSASGPSTAGTQAPTKAAPGQGDAAAVQDQGASATQSGADQPAAAETQGTTGGADAADTSQTSGAVRSSSRRQFHTGAKLKIGGMMRINMSWGWKDDLADDDELQVRDDTYKRMAQYSAQTEESPPSNVMLTGALWNRPGYKQTAKSLFGIISDKEWYQAGQESSIGRYDPIGDAAFDLLDDDYSNIEVGAFIGFSFRPMSGLFRSGMLELPISYNAISEYILDLLDEYDLEFDEPEISPRDVGNTVYSAIIAAGGSPEEAYRQARWASDRWGGPALSGSGKVMIRWKDPVILRYQTLNIGKDIPEFVDRPSSHSFSFDFYAPWTLGAVYAEASRVLRSYDKVVPNDPLYKKSGGLGKVGGAILKGFGAIFGGVGVGTGGADDAEANDQWGLSAVGFTPRGSGNSAWDTYDGMQKNIVVAVIDSGLDLKHPDRPKYIWKNPDEIPDNGKDDDGNGYVDDIHGWNFVSENNDIDDNYGHGTFVTGIIAANTNNGEGIAGINPGARIMVLKASNNLGSARDLAVYRALRYAVDNGARVINISLGNRGKSRLMQIGLNYAHAMGCIVVVAAGNEGADIAEFTPQSSRRVISVGSTNIDGSRRGNSNKGLSLALVAPGQSIYSLTAANAKRDGRIAPILGGKYHRLNGTSFAAPFVSGAASLVWARNPELTNTQVEDVLLASATAIGKTGWHPETGMGQLAAHAAMAQSSDTAFAPRITEAYLNQDRRKVASVDVYGIIRGPVQSYTLDVGRGDKPDKDEWQRVFGPSNKAVDLGHIVRIPGTFFSKGSRWTIRLTVLSTSGETRVQRFLIEKKKS